MQILSGFEVDRVVFMCVLATVFVSMGSLRAFVSVCPSAVENTYQG